MSTPGGEMAGGRKASDLNLVEDSALYTKASLEPYLLFGVERTTEGYKVKISFVKDGIILNTKYGADQLKHHALAMVDSLLTQYIIDSYNAPEKFFESVQVR